MNIDKLFNSGCKIVCVETEKNSEYLESMILNQRPSYETSIDPRFLPKKFGPFTIKMNKSIQQILMKDPAIKAKGEKYLKELALAFDTLSLFDRRPRSTAYFQRMNLSLLLGMANKKNNYLFHDRIYQAPSCFMFMLTSLNSLIEFHNNHGSAIWITLMPYDDLITFLREDYANTSVLIFEWKNEELIPRESPAAIWEHTKDEEVRKVQEFLQKEQGILKREQEARQIEQEVLQEKQEALEIVKIELIKQLDSTELDNLIMQIAKGTFNVQFTAKLYQLLEEKQDPGFYYNIIYHASEYKRLFDAEFPYPDILEHCEQMHAQLGALEFTWEKANDAEKILNKLKRKTITESDLIKNIMTFKYAHNEDLWYELAQILEPYRSKSLFFEQIYKESMKESLK